MSALELLPSEIELLVEHYRKVAAKIPGPSVSRQRLRDLQIEQARIAPVSSAQRVLPGALEDHVLWTSLDVADLRDELTKLATEMRSKTNLLDSTGRYDLVGSGLAERLDRIEAAIETIYGNKDIWRRARESVRSHIFPQDYQVPPECR